MNADEILSQFSETGVITDAVVETIQENAKARKGLLELIEEHPSHSFPVALLKELMRRRKNPQEEISADTLMYAGYLVSIERNVSNSLLLWQAKQTDFDTHCGFDIQLVISTGATQTIAYLKTLPPDVASKAIPYIGGCTEEAEDVENYFSKANRPYYI